MTILEAQEEAEAWESVERERAEKDAEIARLRAALKPFAELAGVHVRTAEALGRANDYATLRAIDLHNPQKDVTIRVADCRAALKAMEGT